MTYQGEVKNGVIVFAGDARLPDGTLVQILPLTARTDSGQAADELFDVDKLAVDTGISDLATNVDHYLYGHPKVNDGG